MPITTLTDNDRTVLSTLTGSERPLSAYDILEKARPSSLKAPTQVYRSLQKLEHQRLVHRIEALSAFIACSERCGENHKPGFVICRDCGSVREFDDARVGDVARDAAGPAFEIALVAFEVYGHCASCRSGPAPASGEAAA